MKPFFSLFLLLATALASFADPPWLTNTKVSDDTLNRKQNEVCLALWRNNLYAGYNDWRYISTFSKVSFARSTDRGSSFLANVWVAQDSTNDDSIACDPSLSVDDIGTLYYTLVKMSGGVLWVYFCRSTDYGVSFEPTRFISPGHTMVDYPKNSVRGQNVYLAFMDFFTNNYHIYFKKATDRGLTWGSSVRVDHATAGSRFGAVPKEGLDGTIYVSWGYDRRSGIDTLNGIYCSRSTDGGATFQNEVFVGYTKFLRNTSNPRVMIAPSFESSPVNASDLFLLVNDSRGLNSQDRYNMNVYSTRSTDGGLTWSPRVKVNDDSTTVNDTTQQFMPWLAVDYHGWLHALWYDGRRFGGGSSRYDVFYAYSRDGGLTWSQNERVTDTSFVAKGFFGDYLGITTDSNYVYVGWADGRNDSLNPDIYLSRRALPYGVEQEPGGKPLPPALELAQSTPNPVRGSTTISFALSEPGLVDLSVYDISGRKVRTLLSGKRKAGFGSVRWDVHDQSGTLVPPGVYLYRLKVGSSVRTKKLIVL